MGKVTSKEAISSETSRTISLKEARQAEQKLQDSIFDMNIKRQIQETGINGALTLGSIGLGTIFLYCRDIAKTPTAQKLFSLGEATASIFTVYFAISCIATLIRYAMTKKDKLNNKKLNEKIHAEEDEVHKIRKENDPKYKIPEQKYSNLTVAVVDDYYMKYEKCNNKSHGELVEKYIRETLPGVKIIRYSQENLVEVAEDIKAGTKIDAVNFSIGDPFGISCDANDSINTMKKKFKKNNPIFKATSIILTNKTEKISDTGVKVYQSNTNDFPKKVGGTDLYDFNDKYPNGNNPNIITVSGKELTLLKIGIFSLNSMYFPFSDKYETSIWKLNRIGRGIDINEDGLVDYVNKGFSADTLLGNSFATPTRLAKDLKKLADKQSLKTCPN